MSNGEQCSTIEAMKQALEALERSVATCFDQYAHQQVMSQPDHFINQVITSLRQAIASAEGTLEAEKQERKCENCGEFGPCCQKQEPVAWYIREKDLATTDLEWVAYHQDECEPLYTHPEPKRECPQAERAAWVGLTEEEVEDCFHHVDEDGIGLFDFAEALEAKLKEKNT